MRYLTIALSKGRLTKKAIEFFEAIDIDCTELKEDSRKLILTDEKNKIKFFLAKPSDVPVYVEYGAADIGMVGKDTLLEAGRDLYEVLDLDFAKCRMCLAGPKGGKEAFEKLAHKRIATKYPHIACDYFEQQKGESIEVIKLSGSIELAPLIGLSDVIVDIVESGRTLVENDLEVWDTIADISARLVVNRVSMKMENERISRIVEGIRNQLGGE